MSNKLEFTLAILNGLVGDYLDRTSNGLATPMAFVRDGAAVRLDRAGLLAAYPNATPRLAVFVHGLMCTEDSWYFPDGSSYGALLERELGFSPLYLRYNSGLPIAHNGAALSELLEQLVTAFPVPVTELLLVGYSMGGLVVRSACHAASLAEASWLPLVRRAVYIATPHLGAPMERLGRAVSKLLSTIPDPYTRLISDIAELRSAGLKDLGNADLRHEDRCEGRGIWLSDPRHPVPLLPSIQHYLIAGSLWVDARLAGLFGDSIVPLASATNGFCIDAASIALPPSHVRIVPGVNHVALAHHRQVYEHLLAFCREGSP